MSWNGSVDLCGKHAMVGKWQCRPSSCAAPASGLMVSVIGDGGREASVAPDAAPRRATEGYGPIATARRRRGFPKTAQNARPRRPSTRKMAGTIFEHAHRKSVSTLGFYKARQSPSLPHHRCRPASFSPLCPYAIKKPFAFMRSPNSFIFERAALLGGRAYSSIFLGQSSTATTRDVVAVGVPEVVVAGVWLTDLAYKPPQTDAMVYNVFLRCLHTVSSRCPSEIL
ncbi:hypothetical protein BOTBODRAFT_181229 [Botryobasidium botryosum FD-172 SS1]|uniref:Uncharacterized protein n=1 Tax=Botryobasidium botryosum (strain FD-172 SS1) TaxID=930990 RepID=A0A067LU79_BOTB1|nr:hypothetical protein BOTBODRAFT_181229 [Botryobasidium botryosum FD-172 SS1]